MVAQRRRSQFGQLPPLVAATESSAKRPLTRRPTPGDPTTPRGTQPAYYLSRTTVAFHNCQIGSKMRHKVRGQRAFLSLSIIVASDRTPAISSEVTASA